MVLIGSLLVIHFGLAHFTMPRSSSGIVVAPHVKLNIIRDYEVVEKKEVKMPDELRGIVKCANPKCITNNEPMSTIFHVIDKDNCIVKCHYCEKEQRREESFFSTTS